MDLTFYQNGCSEDSLQRCRRVAFTFMAKVILHSWKSTDFGASLGSPEEYGHRMVFKESIQAAILEPMLDISSFFD